MKIFYEALDLATGVERGFLAADLAQLNHWEGHGAKKGDAVIIAQLEAAGVRYLVSERSALSG